jgi:hypothetical protein
MDFRKRKQVVLKCGDHKPLIGSCHEGRLDLIYYRDPGLKEGQPFPLWTIQIAEAS